ncbi:GNAT family N-acetyltransferase [Clostridium hydrogeniformans]|uniref:GNAT family N-acetyltransferase n=1 Tax=Clostridium hydrogeniformans TaxID=349933 RepID=UPI0004857124|nr:GNAT family N-acetyltransferase [Clostridium hydrogeniformans]
MEELKKSEFTSVLQLLHEEKVHSSFAYAVLEGKQPGKVYVDTKEKPSCCLITCKSGKYLVAGDTGNLKFNNFISDYLYNKKNHKTYFDLYSSSKEWVKKIDEILGDNAAKLSRQVFQWDSSNLSSISTWSQSIPEGFELKKMETILFDKYVKEVDSSYKESWENSYNFISKGFGFCILKDNEFVSVCNTYYVREGFAEIDIVTNNKFRKQGFALITCSKFIEYCLENNIKPIWDCDNGNESSKALAIKLGFNSVETYEMHWWHENKDFIDSYLKKFKYNN